MAGLSDPFLLLAHHNHAFYPLDPFRPISNLLLPEGFPSHPHRGFQTVTYVMEGGMVHRDNLGVKQTYGAGSVQVLDAGSGLMHEEMWSIDPWKRTGIEIYQLWVNLPAQHKMSKARIQLLGEGTDTPLPRVTLPSKAEVVVIAGEVAGQRSPSALHRTPLSILHVTVQPGGHFEHPLPRHHTCLVYVRKGDMTVKGGGDSDSDSTRPAAQRSLESSSSGGAAVATHCMAWLGGSGDAVLLANEGNSELDFLLLEGEPLGEPRAAGGSFVMNTPQEIGQAYEDYNRGFFGAPWDHKLSDEDWLSVVRRNRRGDSEPQ
ncbi:RmlC-like cupin domain-containing protein [Tribonema minus]|uniref:RmlC-like cupin domain-containing protein n=1 Tax=Tribonema minus TaxID=303371 RepID=A0A835YT14_9STRA|nr:RmlC-like cupin domain-containing protein [Tribonema minus]